jgi:hypothetical protein
VSSGFGDLTTHAHDLVAAGDLAGARELLGDALSAADPTPGNASAELAEAAGLQARVLVALGESRSARGWAAFAYSAATRLYGASDQRTVAAAATLAAVLHRVGSHARAAHLYRDVITELTATDGPESARVLAAHADLATARYALGECEAARTLLQDAWELHREVYGDGHVSGIKMLARLGAMQRDCRRFTEAYEHLALAQELCRTHLAADHPLAVQVTALACASADPDHSCAARPPSTSDGTSLPPAPAPAAPTQAPARPTTPLPPQPRFPPTGSVSPPPVVPPATPPAASPIPRPAASPIPVPGPRVPVDQDPHLPGRSTGAGSVHVDPDRYDRWWPPEAAEPDAGGEADHPAREPDHPGGELDHPGGVTPSGSRTASTGPVQYLPERVQRAPLTAVYRPPYQRPRRMLPIVLGGLVAVLLIAGAVTAGIALVGDRRPRPAGTTGAALAWSTSPSGSPPAAPGHAVPGTPPAAVTLRDTRDSVALTWTYPPGAEGPVVVSGGRTGQESRALQELPAGTTSFTVYGLNRSTDYCFIVAVVYSVDLVGRATPVCTARVGSSPRR